MTIIVSPKRRWFRFSLRTLFVVVTVFGFWLGWQLSIVRERKAVLSEIQRVSSPGDFSELSVSVLEGKDNYGSLPEYARVSRIRRCLGDNSYWFINLPEKLSPTLVERTEYVFPEANLHITGASRDSLYAPESKRRPNVGTIFKTGLIEK